MLAVTLVGSIGEANAPSERPGADRDLGRARSGPERELDGVRAGRDRRPQPGLATAVSDHRPARVSLTCVAVYSLLGYVNGTALLDVMIALYTVATIVSSREALIAGLVTLVCLLVTTAIGNPFGALGGGEFLIPGEIVAAVSIGVALGNRRAYLRAVEERADQAERTREEEAARRVDAERLRIARELHDAVAHTLSMINVQAGAAAHVARDHPEQAAAALEAIRLASKEGLREMRSIVNVLRQSDEAEATQPAPGLAMLDDLVATTNRAGLNTTCIVEGTPRRLAATVDLAAYRIIQESLTNAIRHAGPASATVSLAWGDDRLGVRSPRHRTRRIRERWPGRCRGLRVQAMGSWECVSARSPREGRSRRDRRPAAASSCMPNCRSTEAHDPRAPRRRSSPGARRISNAARLSRRHRGRR